MNAYEIGALLGLLALVLTLYWLQRKTNQDSAGANAAMSERVKSLEDSFLSLPMTEKRMAAAVTSAVAPIHKRLDARDNDIAEIKSLLSSVANKVGA